MESKDLTNKSQINLAEHAAEFGGLTFERLGIPDEMRDALDPNIIDLFPTGMPAYDTCAREVRQAMTNVVFRQVRDYKGRLEMPVAFQTPNRGVWRQSIHRLQDNRQWNDNLAIGQEHGLGRNVTFHPIILSLCLQHMPHLLKTADIELEEEDAHTLGIPTRIKKEDLSALLIHLGHLPPPPTRENQANVSSDDRINMRSDFDKKIVASYWLAQFASAHLLLSDVMQLYQVGGKVSGKALIIFAQYKDLLFKDTVRKKVEAHMKIASAFRELAHQESDEIIKTACRKFAVVAANAGTDLEHFVRSLVEMHYEYGFDLPHFLEPYAPQVTELETSAQPLEAEPSDTEKLAALRQRITVLEANIIQAFAGISLTKKQRETNNFKVVKEYLTHTVFQGSEAAQAFRLVNNDEAKQLFDALTFLLSLSVNQKSLEAARQKLETHVAHHQVLLSELQALKNFAKEQRLDKYGIKWPSDYLLHAQIAHIMEEWPNLSWLVEHCWEGGEKDAAAIRQLLFAPTSAPEAEDTHRVTRAEAEATVDGRLSEVIFPHSKTPEEHEVTRVLRNWKLTKRQLESIEWERVRDLATLRNQLTDYFDTATLYQAQADEKFLGEELPYFILLFENNNRRYVIAESPIKDSATYIVSEQHADGPWQDVLTVSQRTEALVFGATRLFHTTEAPHGEGHIRRLVTALTHFEPDLPLQ